MSRQRSVPLSVAVSITVGTAVAAIALFVAWHTLSGVPQYSYSSFTTMRSMHGLREAIKVYSESHASLPQGLGQLGEDVSAERDGEDRFVDGWYNPVDYAVQGDTYSLTAYGRDGLAGGEGLDADCGKDGPFLVRPTPRQFFFELPTGDTTATCVLAGIISGLAAFYAMRAPYTNVGSFAAPFVKAIIVIFAALLLSLLLSFLHIPSH